MLRCLDRSRDLSVTLKRLPHESPGITAQSIYSETKMKKLCTAVALAIALPSIAHAQAAPTPPAKEDCCAKVKANGKKCCCDDMDKGHADHDMKSAAPDKN